MFFYANSSYVYFKYNQYMYVIWHILQSATWQKEKDKFNWQWNKTENENKWVALQKSKLKYDSVKGGQAQAL
jgi:hypothetical protein